MISYVMSTSYQRIPILINTTNIHERVKKCITNYDHRLCSSYCAVSYKATLLFSCRSQKYRSHIFTVSGKRKPKEREDNVCSGKWVRFFMVTFPFLMHLCMQSTSKDTHVTKGVCRLASHIF